MPTFELNKAIVQKAEEHGLDFALSMIKLRGFGGETEFWDHSLESFTLMAGLAAVTERIKLYASTPILALPPAIVARMAATIDSIAPGRFGVNIVTGWAPGEYSQMGLWPGRRALRQPLRHGPRSTSRDAELWDEGVSDFKGEYLHHGRLRAVARARRATSNIVSAGQSDAGMRFSRRARRLQLHPGKRRQHPDVALSDTTATLVDAARETGRDVGALSLFMVITDETDEAAQAKWKDYHDGADHAALAYMAGETATDTTSDGSSTARTISLPEGAVNFNMGTLVGSYETRRGDARRDRRGRRAPRGSCWSFDDFLEGIENFGTRIQPLMASRPEHR